MQRLTAKGPQHSYTLPGECQAEAIDRLGRFEDFYETLLGNQEKLAAELEELRAAGKKNTARFREKLGEKLMASNTLLLLKMQGLE